MDQDLGCKPVGVGQDRQIGRDADGVAPERADRLDGFFDRVHLATGDDDAGSFPRQPFGDRTAQSASAAGDQSGFAFEPPGSVIRHW